MTVVFGLGTRLDVRVRTTRLENSVLLNGQQPGRAENSFFDYSKFEAMKLLSGWDAARCDEHQFQAKIKVSTWAVFELLSTDRNKLRNKKNGTFANAYFLRLAVFRVAFSQFMSLADHKGTQRRSLGA